MGSAHLPADQTTDKPTRETTTSPAHALVEEALRWLPDQTTNARDSGFPDFDQESSDAPIPARHHRPVILFADDNSDLRDYVRRLLSEQYEVETVPDGEAAMAAALKKAP